MSGSDIIVADISDGGGGCTAAAWRGSRGGRPGGNAHDHLPARPLQRLDNRGGACCAQLAALSDRSTDSRS